MLLDDNFFRNATLEICGNLELDKALYASLKYIRNHIPVQSSCAQIYEHNLGSMRTLAMADQKSYQQVNLVTPLPPEIRQRFDPERVKEFPQVVVINNPGEFLLSRAMLDYHQIKSDSVLVLSLVIESSEGRFLMPMTKLGAKESVSMLLEGKGLGSIIFTANPGYRFSSDDVRLIEALQVPYTIAMSNALRHQAVTEMNRELSEENRILQNELNVGSIPVIGAEYGLANVMNLVRKVAVLDSPVLLLGETGTGKDLIAQTLHQLSHRRKNNFVAVNCGAIPQALMDSELFGHTKGAFTGAMADKKGKFERANLGTLFLDEVGELPLEIQVRLLRIIQDGELEKVGSEESISLDIRLIAATHRNLAEMVAKGTFREDLWFRLNVFPISIPPLRERPKDIPLLVKHFLRQKARRLKMDRIPGLTSGAMDILMNHSWPGNVRELENAIEREMILSGGENLRFDDLVDVHRHSNKSLSLDNTISKHIRKVLAMTEGRVYGPGGAAKILEINPSTLRNKMDKLGIPYGRSYLGK